MGVNALSCIHWHKWILVLIFVGAVVLLIQPVYGLDYYNLSYPDGTTTPTPVSPSNSNYGFLSIDSSPTGANLYADGSYLSSTPTIHRFTPGVHTLRFSKTGYLDYYTTTTISAGQDRFINVILIPVTTTQPVNPPLPPSTGSLRITSIPSGADIYVDGIYQGTTPKTLSKILPETHTIRITKKGYKDYSTTAWVTKMQSTSVTTTLFQTGSLYIFSSPSEADIYADGIYQGTTPTTLSDILPGTHTIRITKKGFDAYTTTAEVNTEQTTSLTATLIQTYTPPSTLKKNPTTVTTHRTDTPPLTPTSSLHENTSVPKSTTRTALLVPSVISQFFENKIQKWLTIPWQYCPVCK